jgi:hypothetical protein
LLALRRKREKGSTRSLVHYSFALISSRQGAAVWLWGGSPLPACGGAAWLRGIAGAVDAARAEDYSLAARPVNSRTGYGWTPLRNSRRISKRYWPADRSEMKSGDASIRSGTLTERLETEKFGDRKMEARNTSVSKFFCLLSSCSVYSHGQCAQLGRISINSSEEYAEYRGPSAYSAWFAVPYLWPERWRPETIAL